tara:strand:+ start:239 stop:619 length:381 start_codon:yes stop_codon:yes gene_type:complete
MNKSEFKFKTIDGTEYLTRFEKPNKLYYGEDCDGKCSPPDSENPTILINPHRGPQTILNTSIHEFAHAHFWGKSEKEVKKFADSLSRFLYNHCGWRLKQDGSWPRTKGAMAEDVLKAWREQQKKSG